MSVCPTIFNRTITVPYIANFSNSFCIQYDRKRIMYLQITPIFNKAGCKHGLDFHTVFGNVADLYKQFAWSVRSIRHD
jgi:hypothetical protein